MLNGVQGCTQSPTSMVQAQGLQLPVRDAGGSDDQCLSADPVDERSARADAQRRAAPQVHAHAWHGHVRFLHRHDRARVHRGNAAPCSRKRFRKRIRLHAACAPHSVRTGGALVRRTRYLVRMEVVR